MYVFAVMFEIKGVYSYSCVSYGKDRFVKLRNVHFIVKHRLLWTHCLETAVSLLPWKRILRACRCKEKTFYDVNYNSCTMRAPLIVRRDIYIMRSHLFLVKFHHNVTTYSSSVACYFVSFVWNIFSLETLLGFPFLWKKTLASRNVITPIEPPFKLNSRQTTSELLFPLLAFGVSYTVIRGPKTMNSWLYWRWYCFPSKVSVSEMFSMYFEVHEWSTCLEIINTNH